jgi:transposase-like protein
MCGPLVPSLLAVAPDVEELLDERSLGVDHTTVWRWVQRYGPEMEQPMRRHLKPTNKSWRVDETYLR